MRPLFIFASAVAFSTAWAQPQPLASDADAPVPSVAYFSAFDAPLAPLAPPKADAKAPPQTPPKTAPSPPLSPPQALQLALLLQPNLLVQPQMSAQEQAEILAGVRQLSHRVDRAWVEAVAAQQSLATRREVHEAAHTAAELGQRMVKAGHWSQVPLLQAQLLAAGTASQVAQAQLQAFSARENLAQLTGLWGTPAAISLPPQLPKLPAAPLPWADFEPQALRNSLALASAAFNARQAQAQVNAQDVQALQTQWKAATAEASASATSTDASAPAQALNRAAVSAPALPAQRARPHPALMEALTEQAHADTLATRTRSQAREAWFRYRSAWDTARHQRDVVLPLSTALQEETQLRYNGMLQSTWDLLASARARLESVNAVTQSLRDFWLAHSDLQAVLGGVAVEFAAPSGPSSNSNNNAAQGH